MLNLTSRSATVLVIFIVAILAFCLASVFASMTGPISILPNESESGGIFDNLSAITDNDVSSDRSYGYKDYDDYSYSDDSSSSSSSSVETTTDDSSSSSSDSSNVETTTDDSSSSSSSSSSSGDSSSGGGSSGSDSKVEVTTG